MVDICFMNIQYLQNRKIDKKYIKNVRKNKMKKKFEKKNTLSIIRSSTEIKKKNPYNPELKCNQLSNSVPIETHITN